MATGYTSEIEKGISFNEFCLTCARAFGALIIMRDVSINTTIPNEFKPSTHHKEALKEEVEELRQLSTLTTEQCTELALKQYEEGLKDKIQSDQKQTVLRTKYEDMLKKVELWIPPSSEHIELKNFMVQQIKESMDYDCTPTSHKITLLSGTEWLENQRENTFWSIKYHTERWDEEVESCKRRTKWVKLLKESLEVV